MSLNQNLVGLKVFIKKYNDTQKKIYCNKHGITLICIPYWDEGIMDYDYIMKMAGY